NLPVPVEHDGPVRPLREQSSCGFVQAEVREGPTESGNDARARYDMGVVEGQLGRSFHVQFSRRKLDQTKRLRTTLFAGVLSTRRRTGRKRPGPPRRMG